MDRVDIADYLSQIFLGTSGTSHSSSSGRVGQGLRPMTIGGIGGSGGSMNYQNSLRPQAKEEKAAPVSSPAGGNEVAVREGGKSITQTDVKH